MLSPVGTIDTTRLIATLGVAVVGYLIGSIPAANLIAQRHGVDDLRRIGDRNPGYWNARSALGRREAIAVFVADVAKGAAAASIGMLVAAMFGNTAGQTAGQTAATTSTLWWLGYVGTGAAMVGHAFPVFDRFRGGRSVLAFVGGAVVVATAPAAVAITVLLMVYAIARRFDIAARAGVIAFPFAQLALEGPYRTAATGILMTFIGLRFAQAAISGRSDTDDPATAGSS